MSPNRTSLLARFVLAFILAFSFCLPYGFAAGLLIALRERVLGRNVPLATESLFVNTKGEPLIRVYQPEKRRFEYRTLDGEPVAVDPQDNGIGGLRLQSAQAFRSTQLEARGGWESRVFSIADAANPPKYWSFIVTDDSSNGRCHFVGYDSTTFARTGFITPTGVSTLPPSSAEEFSIAHYPVGGLVRMQSDRSEMGEGFTPGKPERSQYNSNLPPPWVVFLPAKGTLFRIDLDQRKVEDLLKLDDVISAGAALRPAADTGDPHPFGRQPWQTFIALRRPDRIVVVDPVDSSTTEFHLPDEYRNEELSLHLLSNDQALIVIEHLDLESETEARDLVWLDRGGAVPRKRSVTLHVRGPSQSIHEELTAAVCAAPIPLLYGVIPWFHPNKEAGDYLSRMFSEGWPALLLLSLIAIGLTVATDYWQRMHRLPRSYGWLAFVFLFGLPGFVGYLLHRRWPVRKLAPPPAPTGLEVFA